MLDGILTCLLGTSTWRLGAVKLVTVISVLSKKPSPTQIYRCLPAPHRCGAQEQCQVIGQTFAGFSSLRTLVNDGKYVSMVHSILHDTLASAARIKAAIMKCGYTWLSLVIMATTNPRERHEQRHLLKERSAPYQPSKERSKAGEDESDRSLPS